MESTNIYLTKTNDCGTFKCVHNVSQTSDVCRIVPIPTAWLGAATNPNTIALVINKTMTAGEIAAEIKTMYTYRDISPQLYGTIWYTKQPTPLYLEYYSTPSIANSKNAFNKSILLSNDKTITVIFFMERCDNMNECIKNPDTYVTKLVALFYELVHTYNIFSTDIKIENLCCSENGKFRLLDVDPNFIFNGSQNESPNEICGHIMIVIFLAQLSHYTPLHIENAQSASSSSLITAPEGGVLNERRCNDDHKIEIGNKLITLAFPENYTLLNKIIEEAGLHRQANPGKFDAFYMICHYMFGDDTKVKNMCSQYDKAPDKSTVIETVKLLIIECFAKFSDDYIDLDLGGGGVRKRRSNKRRLHKRRENKRRSNKNKFKRTKRKLI